MKVRVGNICWHSFHVQHCAVAEDAGFFREEGVDAEIVHAKMYTAGIQSSRPNGHSFNEAAFVLPDMIAFNVDIVPDVSLSTPLLDRAQGRDELRIIGGWRSVFRCSFMTAPEITSLRDIKGKRLGTWMVIGGDQFEDVWVANTMREAGIDPVKDIQWVVGYQYGSIREAAKPLREGKTDAARVHSAHVNDLRELGFNQLIDSLKEFPPHEGGAPIRVTVARESFIRRCPEEIKRYWKATIRAYQFSRIVPEHYPLLRASEAWLRLGNPDEYERSRDLYRMDLHESHFYPLDGQVPVQGAARIMKEFQKAGVVPETVTDGDLKDLLCTELVEEAWEELRQTDEVKRNLERLSPVVEKWGF